MADNKHFTLLNRQTVTADQNGEIQDLLLHNTLNIGATVHTAGSGGNIILQHSDSTDPSTFQTLATISVSSTGTTFESISNFLRYVRWVTDGSVAGGPPVVSVSIVAKSA
jgi:hypothetical protein